MAWNRLILYQNYIKDVVLQIKSAFYQELNHVFVYWDECGQHRNKMDIYSTSNFGNHQCIIGALQIYNHWARNKKFQPKFCFPKRNQSQPKSLSIHLIYYTNAQLVSKRNYIFNFCIKIYEKMFCRTDNLEIIWYYLMVRSNLFYSRNSKNSSFVFSCNPWSHCICQ